MYIRFFILIVFLCWGVLSSSAQEKAWSAQYKLPAVTVYADFPEPVELIRQVIDEEDNDNSLLKAWVYAVGIETGFQPTTSGQWDTIPGKGYVWRLGIHAENALSLNLLIENYKLFPGMALYVYNEAMTNIAGPFDNANNGNGGILPVQSLPGDHIVIEWNIPLKISQKDDFTIVSVGYGFRDMAGQGMSEMATAASCNVDINCKDGNHWQREKRAVVRMETITRSGYVVKTQYCTGTLVNQTSKTKQPYILTANHCVSTNDMAQATTFVFSYEKAVCKGTTPALPQGITGSSLLATKKELDFALLKLSQDVDASHHPYYAGWNASPVTPANAVGIHHPQGDVKKISMENDPLETGTFNDDQTDMHCDKNAHWVVSKWDVGVTEKGSSGSPLFDPNHLVVGSLSGGNATCMKPEKDYYSKVSEQWNKYTTPAESLKPWLDPENKGVTSYWGYDPVAPFDGECDTLGHIGYNETQMLIASDKWGYLTGHNNKKWTGFAEKITNDTVANIIGLEANIGKAYSSGSRVRFSIWQGKDFPVGSPVHSIDTIVTSDFRRYPMQMYFPKTLEIKGDYYLGYSIQYQPVDTFAVLQSAKRSYEGVSALFVEQSDGTWMAMSEDVPPTYSSLGIRALGHFGKNQAQPYQAPRNGLKIIYQPGDDIVYVYFSDPGEKVVLECYDATGKQMPVNELNRQIVMYDEVTYLQIEMNISNLSYGMYLLQVFDTKKKQTGKVIRL